MLCQIYYYPIFDDSFGTAAVPQSGMSPLKLKPPCGRRSGSSAESRIIPSSGQIRRSADRRYEEKYSRQNGLARNSVLLNCNEKTKRFIALD
jgi:hypothetical protein